MTTNRLVARLCRARERGQDALVRAIARITPSDERIRVAGLQRKLMTRAVTVRVKVVWPIYTLFPVTIEQTFHAIAVKGQWKWILSADQYEYYSEGTCPYS